MNIIHIPFLKTFLEATNKKSLLEIQPQHLTRTRIKQLEPITDIDGRVITFRPYNKNSRLTQPTEYEDCFERMTFENSEEPANMWRDNELYGATGEESKKYIREPYSSNDIPLAESISNRIYSQYNYNLSNDYYPDTDLSFDDKCTLKLINFTEDIIPASFPRDMNVDFATIRNFAKAAVYAIENGVVTSEISRLIEKSILKGSRGTNHSAEVDLFNFLVKYPNNRSIVVIKSEKGKEFFDKTAATYYDLFVKKYFADSNTALNVLSECKTNENGLQKVNVKLCEIATLLRRKSALGIPEKQTQTYSFMTPKPSGVCPIQTPWGKAETELLQKLKSDGELNEEYYTTARSMLKDDRKTVNYVLENIDNVVKRNSEIKELENKYNNSYPTTFEEEKSGISTLLRKELAKNRQNPKDIIENCILLDNAKMLEERNIPINISYNILRTIDSLIKYNKKDLSNFTNIINKCANPEVYGKENANKLSKLCCNLYRETGSFTQKETTLIDNICKHADNGDFRYISGLETLIRFNKSPRKSIIQIANTNLDECAKYMGRLNEATKNSNTYKEHKYFIDSILQSEIKNFISKEQFDIERCVILKKLEELCSNKISYTDFLQELQNLEVSIK